MILRTAVNDSKLFRIRAPCKVVNRAFLIQGHTAIEIASGTKKVQPSLAVITLVRVIHLGLSKDKGLSTEGVPFDLTPICLVECFLAGWCAGQGDEAINSNTSRSTLWRRTTSADSQDNIDPK